ncbi:ribonuclease P protein component [Acetomicrobium sp. S15 = DSM 107314]|uniref:ribonuclease P protein component n=1 Tax=Acetomicrobium sp. S15 = DSM 107314 TaxID=2529858 RepID=UPI0018E17E0F
MGGFSYPRSARLVRGWEYDYVFRTGRRKRGALVRLLFAPGPDGATRFGLAVGGRQGGSADRNRGKRILREAVRRLRPWTRKGIWMVVMLTDMGLKANAREVYEEMAKLCHESGLLADEWPGLQWMPRRGADSA